MKNEKETKSLVRQFFKDSYNFWKREGKCDNEAYSLALKEAANIKHDPFIPYGEPLDEKAKIECIMEIRRGMK